ncbi:efflux RND transporter periplasmic adaptor subunit [Nitrospira sp. Kam-Ns4a]
MTRRAGWTLVATVLLLVAAVPVLMNLGREGAEAPPAAQSVQASTKPPTFAMPVEVAAVTVGRVTEAANAVGTLQANESVMIRPEIPGRVTRINFREGQQVEQGMVLFELDSTELEAELAQAAASLEIARLNYERAQKLIVNDNVSQQEHDQAATTFKSAQANYKLYQERLAKTRIVAPFAGYLGHRRISPGDYVQAGRDLVNLEDLSVLKIDFRIPETLFSRLRVGQRVEVAVDAFPGQVFEGRVYSMDPRVDEVTRTVPVRARIPNPQARLRPGMFASLRLVLGVIESALLIPEEAVVPHQEQTFVFRVADGLAKQTEVKLGVRERGVVQVVSGLDAGDQVIKAGLQKIRDGMPVQAVRHP